MVNLLAIMIVINNVKYYVVDRMKTEYKGARTWIISRSGTLLLDAWWSKRRFNSDYKKSTHTWKNAITELYITCQKGIFNIDPQGYTYIYKATSTNQSVPNGVGNSQWVKVLDNKTENGSKKYPVQVHCNIKLQWTWQEISFVTFFSVFPTSYSYAKLFFLFPVMFANFKHLLKLCFQLFTCIKETDVMHTESFPSWPFGISKEIRTSSSRPSSCV